MNIIQGTEQYTMGKDFYQLALLEFKLANPLMRRESNFTQTDRDAILRRAQELKDKE